MALVDHLTEPGDAPDQVAAQDLRPGQDIAQLATEETVADVLRDPKSFLGGDLSRGGFVQHATGHPLEADDLRQ